MSRFARMVHSMLKNFASTKTSNNSTYSNRSILSIFIRTIKKPGYATGRKPCSSVKQ